MPTSTVRLHRVLRAKPEKVYRAFLDAEAIARWLPPNGFTSKVDQLDAKVGGTFRMSFRNFSTGNGHSFGGTYLESCQFNPICSSMAAAKRRSSSTARRLAAKSRC